MQCHDRVINCHDNTSAFRLALCCDIHFYVATFFLYFFSYCVTTDSKECRYNLSTVILHSSLSLLPHSSAYCEKLLQLALGFCHDIVKLCWDIFHFPVLAIFFFFFHSFRFFFIKTLQNINLGENSIIHH